MTDEQLLELGIYKGLIQMHNLYKMTFMILKNKTDFIVGPPLNMKKRKNTTFFRYTHSVLWRDMLRQYFKVPSHFI